MLIKVLILGIFQQHAPIIPAEMEGLARWFYLQNISSFTVIALLVIKADVVAAISNNKNQNGDIYISTINS